jgi:hypothetical protein
MRLKVTFDWDRFWAELPFASAAEVYRAMKMLDPGIDRTTVYKWITRRAMPMNRMAELLGAIHAFKGKKVDVHKYLIVSIPRKRDTRGRKTEA